MKRFAILAIAGLIGVTAMSGVQAKSTKSPSATVYFAVGQSKLTADDRAELRSLSKTIVASDTVSVNGYVQVSSSTSNNHSLSLARAQAVRSYLKKLGVKAKIAIAGKGLSPKNHASKSARRADVYVTHASRPAVDPTPSTSPSASPSPSSSVSGYLISGTVNFDNRNSGNCSDTSVTSLTLVQGSTQIDSVTNLTWDSTGMGLCTLNFAFNRQNSGTYTVTLHAASTASPSSWSFDPVGTTTKVSGNFADMIFTQSVTVAYSDVTTTVDVYEND